MTVDRDWSQRLTTHVGNQVRQRRSARGWSARRLSDETDELGYRIDANVIANMETGRRVTLPFADLLVLAAALRMPPSLLICPVGSNVDVELFPGEVMDVDVAFMEFVGDGVTISIPATINVDRS